MSNWKLVTVTSVVEILVEICSDSEDATEIALDSLGGDMCDHLDEASEEDVDDKQVEQYSRHLDADKILSLGDQ